METLLQEVADSDLGKASKWYEAVAEDEAIGTALNSTREKRIEDSSLAKAIENYSKFDQVSCMFSMRWFPQNGFSYYYTYLAGSRTRAG